MARREQREEVDRTLAAVQMREEAAEKLISEADGRAAAAEAEMERLRC